MIGNFAAVGGAEFYFASGLTSAWPVISSAHFCHCGHLSRSSNVVSLDVQQHCSWLYQKADRHTPSFRSVIQSTARSITPASVPGEHRTCQYTWGPNDVFQRERIFPVQQCFMLWDKIQIHLNFLVACVCLLPSWPTWEESDEQHHHPSWPGVQQAFDELPDWLFALTGDLGDRQQAQIWILHSLSLNCLAAMKL